MLNCRWPSYFVRLFLHSHFNDFLKTSTSVQSWSQFRHSPFALLFYWNEVCAVCSQYRRRWYILKLTFYPLTEFARIYAYAPELTNRRKLMLAEIFSEQLWYSEQSQICSKSQNYKCLSSLVNWNFGFSIKSRIKVLFTVHSWLAFIRTNKFKHIYLYSIQKSASTNKQTMHFREIGFVLMQSPIIEMWIFRTDCALQNANVLHWFQRFPMAPYGTEWMSVVGG